MPRRPSFAVITVLHAIARGLRHGFDVIDDTGLAGGTVYPALSRLERDGYLRSDWEDPAVARAEKRPPRRYYRVTPQGNRLLDEGVKRYRGLTPVKLTPARRRQ
jgi:DNA-binding PadR family transcriptional regulator